MSDEQNNRWSRRGVIGAVVVGIFGGVGVVTAASQTESVEWLFTIFGAQRGDAPVSVQQISTSPPGRFVREADILLEAERETTVDMLVEIDGEEEPEDGWPLVEGIEFTGEGEQQVQSVTFEETYGDVDDGDLLVTIEETGLE